MPSTVFFALAAMAFAIVMFLLGLRQVAPLTLSEMSAIYMIMSYLSLSLIPLLFMATVVMLLEQIRENTKKTANTEKEEQLFLEE